MKNTKTLADLKRDLKIGTSITMTFNCYGSFPSKQTLIGEKRYIVKRQSNGVQIAFDKNASRGSFLDFPCASLLEYDGVELKIYSAGQRDLTEEEKNIQANEPRDKQMECLDMYSDTNIMYWKRKNYYKDNNASYLQGLESSRGMKYDFNTKKIIDNKIKGELMLAYKLN